MSEQAFSHEREVAADVAREAGNLIRARAGRDVNVREKSAHDLVTETDEEAQRLIIERLRGAFPDYGVLAEEGADVDSIEQCPSRPRWIVDPIDGTTNFAHGLPPYCVSIGLQNDSGDMVVGVIYEIAMDELFAASMGDGATMNGSPIRVSRTPALYDALITTGFPFREFWFVDAYLEVLERFMFDTRGVRRPGSAAADLAYVACGRCDAFFEADLAPWDVAAGIVLVREAGGIVSGLAPGGDPLLGGQIVASNGLIHHEVTAITQSLGNIYAAGPRGP